MDLVAGLQLRARVRGSFDAPAVSAIANAAADQEVVQQSHEFGTL